MACPGHALDTTGLGQSVLVWPRGARQVGPLLGCRSHTGRDKSNAKPFALCSLVKWQRRRGRQPLRVTPLLSAVGSHEHPAHTQQQRQLIFSLIVSSLI